jgi:hypothetical protein
MYPDVIKLKNRRMLLNTNKPENAEKKKERA